MMGAAKAKAKAAKKQEAPVLKAPSLPFQWFAEESASEIDSHN
jgi:hypothetical protein